MLLEFGPMSSIALKHTIGHKHVVPNTVQNRIAINVVCTQIKWVSILFIVIYLLFRILLIYRSCLIGWHSLTKSHEECVQFRLYSLAETFVYCTQNLDQLWPYVFKNIILSPEHLCNFLNSTSPPFYFAVSNTAKKFYSVLAHRLINACCLHFTMLSWHS